MCKGFHGLGGQLPRQLNLWQREREVAHIRSAAWKFSTRIAAPVIAPAIDASYTGFGGVLSPECN